VFIQVWDTNLRSLIVALSTSILAACVGQPASLLPYDLNIPMQVLSVNGTPPAIDGRSRYRELFCLELAGDPDFAQGDCASYLHQLTDEETYAGPRLAPPASLDFKIVVVPGLFSDCVRDFVRAFETSGEALATAGVEMEYLDVSGRSGSDANARIIANYVGALELAPGQRLVLVGHSKGAADILHFLVLFPEQASRVSAVLSVAGAINGSPRADDAEEDYRDWLSGLELATCEAGDGLAMESLTRRYRMNWLANNPLPGSVRYYSLAAFVKQDDVSVNSMRGYRALAKIDPRNDGQLLFYDQVIPGASLLAYLNANHWATALPITETHPLVAKMVVTNNRFPRNTMLKAALDYIALDLESSGVLAAEGQTR
jgi:pimeloyl-ACP methyl ester carboxylesterase